MTSTVTSLERSHLDTSVFGAASNPKHRDHTDSLHLLESCQPRCVWCLSDLALSEATFHEYIHRWELEAASRGVLVVRTTTTNGTAKLRKALQQVGLHGTDIRHVFCAMANTCATLVSADEDFVDPKAKAKKRRRGASVSPCPVLSSLLTSEGVMILMPTGARTRYCECG